MRRSDNPDSNRFFRQSKTYFAKCSACFDKVFTLFQQARGDYLLPVQYREAEKHLKQIKSHLDDLSTVMNTDTERSLSDRYAVINKIALIIEEIDNNLLPLIEARNETLYQNIFDELQFLQTLLEEINVCLFGIQKLQKPKAKPRNRKEKPKGLHLQPDSKDDSVDDSTRLDWRTLLIETLLKLDMVKTSDGRNALLTGIPPLNSNRSHHNSRLDFDMIINQLEELGQLQSGEWPLLIIIKNAFPYVKGFREPEQCLLRVQKILEDRYKNE